LFALCIVAQLLDNVTDDDCVIAAGYNGWHLVPMAASFYYRLKQHWLVRLRPK
jgi:hypothetical protein